MILRWIAPLVLLAAGCAPQATVQHNASVAEAPVVQPAATYKPAPSATPATVAAKPEIAFIDGHFEQGGWVRGKAPEGTQVLRLGETEIAFDDDGNFFAAFDRDAVSPARFEATLAGSTRTIGATRPIAPRDWDIERVNVAKRPSGSSEAWWQKREPEWLAIKSARERETGATGWRQDFIWPVTGRISGRFGRQRIYRGEPGSYHSGLDIAPGNGVPFVAPADGVVVLARTGFSLEGGIVIVDHGAGLNSAFIHLSRLAVAQGDTVRQGQTLGNVGSSGRATGPHLHWSLMWRDKRLDPLLFLPPMP